MNSRDITLQPGWVIVKGKSVHQFVTFKEALSHVDVIGGLLMTTEFYTEHYSKQNADDKKSD